MGSLDDDRYAFAGIVGLDVGPNRHVYVTQWRVPQLWIYDWNGNYVGAVGAGGDGPGEFVSVGGAAWLRDTLWVKDYVMARVSLFDSEGRFANRIHFSIPHPPSGSSIRPGSPLADGHLLASPAYATTAVLEGGLDRVPLLSVTRDGQVRDTLAWQQLRRAFHAIRYGDGRMLHQRNPLSGSTMVATSPTGDAVFLVDPEPGLAAQFQVVRLTTAGDTVWSRLFDYIPIPVDEVYLDRLTARAYEEAAFLHDRVTAGRFREAYLQGLDRPEHLPPVTQALPNIDGTLWLRREENLEERVRWWVLGRDGELLAELRAPSSVRVLEVFEETVWAVEEDDLDVPYIVRFGVDRGGNGA